MVGGAERNRCRTALAQATIVGVLARPEGPRFHRNCNLIVQRAVQFSPGEPDEISSSTTGWQIARRSTELSVGLGASTRVCAFRCGLAAFFSAAVAFFGRFPTPALAVAGFVFGEAAGLAAGIVTRRALFQPLRESDRRAQGIEFLAQTVFQKALKAEMERLGLIGEKDKRGRTGRGLRDVEDLHLPAAGGKPTHHIDAGA